MLPQPVELPVGTQVSSHAKPGAPNNVAIFLVGHARHLGRGQADLGGVVNGILVLGSQGQAVLPAEAGVHEFDPDLLSQGPAFDIAVPPHFKGKGHRLSASLLGWAVVGAAGGMPLDLVRRAEGDVDPPPVRLPPRPPRGEAFVGKGDAAVVLLLGLVVRGVRIGVPPEPELLDELIALVVGGQTLEGFLLFLADDVADVLLHPLLQVSVRGFRAQRFLALPVFLPVGQQQRCGEKEEKGQTAGQKPVPFPLDSHGAPLLDVSHRLTGVSFPLGTPFHYRTRTVLVKHVQGGRSNRNDIDR